MTQQREKPFILAVPPSDRLSEETRLALEEEARRRAWLGLENKGQPEHDSSGSPSADG